MKCPCGATEREGASCEHPLCGWRLRRELAQLRSQAGDTIELAEAEQRGFERGLAHQQSQQQAPK